MEEDSKQQLQLSNADCSCTPQTACLFRVKMNARGKGFQL